ncbi:mitochondrial ribosomal protein S25-domain-containing protein [Russula aff. rugulosa BPL654]|nr:mitochondrial ribosomal protein S25-domain-containing protein [Russula aff. rugulosa BPL654]
MVRRIASQVHKQASRLTRAGFIKTPPVWYEAVLEHPPLPLPPREPPSRTSYDTSYHHPHPGLQIKKLSLLQRQRQKRHSRDLAHCQSLTVSTRTLTEAGAVENEHPISGLKWTRLNQRGRNPSPEDAVQFALNLHQAHGLTLSDAYATSIAQFRTLRAVQHVATRFAAQAASVYGARFGPSATARGFEVENKVGEEPLAHGHAWNRAEQEGSSGVGVGVVNVGSAADRKAWSRGEEYVRLWKEGVRPDYSPALTESIAPVDPADFMGTRGRRFPF